MFEALSDRLERITAKLKSRGRISDADLAEVLSEIRTALLDADVALPVVSEFVSRIKERCQGNALSQSLSPGQQVIKEVHAALLFALGGEVLKITYAPAPPTVVLLAGLQGSGKTTTAAKLARWWKNQGRNPLLVGADLQRPAAVEQLRVLGEQIGIGVFSQPGDPVSCAKAGLEEARRLGRDICIIDTAGRLAIDEALMQEIATISNEVDPHYTFLVIDAMTGQDAVSTAFAFHQSLSISGVIVTKLDGDARGGVALSVKAIVGKPIVFASTGEKIGDFDLFHPDRMADRILGMGDVMTLIEQAERELDSEAVMESATRLLEGRFTLDDFLEQFQQVKKLGSLGGVMKLMPGSNKAMREAADQIDDRHVNRIEAIVRSMTSKERSQPQIIDGSRRVRIAKGSGTSTSDVNQLLRQFKDMQKMMKSVMSGGASSLDAMLGAGGGGLGSHRGAKKQMAAMQALGGGGFEDDSKLASMFGAPTGQGGLYGATGVFSGHKNKALSAASTEVGGVTYGRKGTKKKKKGGRVTPKKAR